jgi:ribosome-associated toxin RatA of RatAB toxin-antitoxin module
MATSALASGKTRSGGRLLAAAAAAFLLVTVGAANAEDASKLLSVREQQGSYTVAARFLVNAPSSVVMSVLTDYERIPRFMPDVRTSIVRQRMEGRAVVEQEAVSSVMLFSKRLHLVLEIQERSDALVFRDVCGTSFTRYEGAWRLASADSQTEITYELSATPTFDVPGFMLKRLLRRDSAQMIEALTREISARAERPGPDE